MSPCLETLGAIDSRLTRLKSDLITGRKVSDKCLEDLATFKIARSLNINLDVTLGESRGISSTFLDEWLCVPNCF